MAFTARLREEIESASADPLRRVGADARFSSSENRLHHVVVHGLSSDTAVIESHDKLQPGARVVFQLGEFGGRPARILQRDGNFYDCEFERALDSRAVQQALSRSRVALVGTGDATYASSRSSRLSPWAIDDAEWETATFSPLVRTLIDGGGALLCWIPPIFLIRGLISWIG